jgi:Tfp pilus assembly major pilin PilA
MNIISWFTGLAGPQKLAAGGMAIMAVIAIVIIVRGVAGDAMDRVEEKGAATAAAQAATKGLNNVETGNRAAEKVRTNDDARRAGCLRHSRTPENC